MTIGGHGLRDHIRLLTPLLALMAAVWFLRLVLYQVGVPPMVLHIVSVTLIGAASTLLIPIMIHSRRFGGYASVVTAIFLLNCWQQALISAAIAFTALTGIVNVYSASEFSFGGTASSHMAGHLLFGIGFGTIFGSAVGCAVLWMLRRVDRSSSPRVASGRFHS